MSQGTVLVTAATGNTGGATVEELLARGRHVRALAHREDARSKRLQELGAEVVFGDFLDLDALRGAVQGVKHAYFCYPIRPGIIQATAYFAQAAKEAGINGVVNMSQVPARASLYHTTFGRVSPPLREYGVSSPVGPEIDPANRAIFEPFPTCVV